MLYVLKQVGLLMLLIFVAACPGLKFLRWAGLKRDDTLELFVLSAASGFALITLGLLMLGMGGFFSPLLIALLPVILFLMSLKEALYFIRAAKSALARCRWSWSAETILFVFFGVFVFINILKALLPPHGPTDVLCYHMTLPKLFLSRGGIVTYPTFFPSYFPANGELLFSLALILGGPSFVGLTHFGFNLLTVLALYVAARKYVRVHYALVPGIIFITAPVVSSWGTMAYTDGILGFYLFLICVLLLEHDLRTRAKETLVWGLLIGMALGTKYQALPLLGVILFYCACARIKDGVQFVGLLPGALCLGVALAAPWFVRNAIQTGNPFFPILGDIFSSSLFPGNVSWGDDTQGAGALAMGLNQMKTNAAAPFSYLYFYAWMKDDYQRFMGPLFLAMIPFATVLVKIRFKWLVLGLTFALGVVATFFLRGNIRYAIVLVILLSWLSGAVCQEVLACSRQRERALLVILLACATALYSLHDYHVMLSNGRFRASLDPQVGASFLRTYERSFIPAELANRIIPPGSTVLFHGLVRFFYFNFEPLSDHRKQAFIGYDEAKTGEDVFRIMRNRGISHLIHDDLLHENDRALELFYQDDSRFRDFMARYLDLIGRANGITIYRLRDAEP